MVLSSMSMCDLIGNWARRALLRRSKVPIGSLFWVYNPLAANGVGALWRRSWLGQPTQIPATVPKAAQAGREGRSA